MRYLSRPPVLSSEPSTSYAGRRDHSARLTPYHAIVPRTACVLINPAQPGQPTSVLSTSIPCCQPDFVERVGGVKSFAGESRTGAGQPVISLQTNAKTYARGGRAKVNRVVTMLCCGQRSYQVMSSRHLVRSSELEAMSFDQIFRRARDLIRLLPHTCASFSFGRHIASSWSRGLRDYESEELKGD